MSSNRSAATDAALAEFIASFYADPYGFVMAVFPWGEEFIEDSAGNPCSNPLKDKKGPEPWQRDLLLELGRHIHENMIRREIGLDMKVWRSAIASGHGVGKSALVAWIIYFLMSTRADTRGAVTASTQFQLEDKTWPELAKWHDLAINKHWFVWTATTLSFAAYPEEKRKNYRMTAATVSEMNTEAFAGLHNEGKTVAVVFDEASGVFPKIWEVAEGALTDGEAFFFAFGNPTKPDGEFADCFFKHTNLYYTRNIDSRSVSHTNKLALQATIDKYGEDDDRVKVRIKGQFPSQAFNGFMAVDAVNEAMERNFKFDDNAALIMAVDVARFGDDSSVIGFRQGRDARTREFRRFKGLSITRLAEIVAKEYNHHRPDALVIEGTGISAGLIDILRDRGYRVVEVHPGARAEASKNFVNKRAEMWDRMREWIYDEGALSTDEDLKEQLTSIQYSFSRDGGKLQLESKDDIKSRGLPSPDVADTLALTFAVTIARRDRNNKRGSSQYRPLSVHEYDPLTY